MDTDDILDDGSMSSVGETVPESPESPESPDVSSSPSDLVVVCPWGWIEETVDRSVGETVRTVLGAVVGSVVGCVVGSFVG